MKKTLRLFVFLISVCLPRIVSAQGENNIWAFSDSIGIDFNTSPPTYFQTHMSVVEGSVAVSDASGSLLFYSSGSYTWDRNGNLMPNGQGLLGNGPFYTIPFPGNSGSSMTGVAVIKSPVNEHQYYLIVTDAVEDQVYDAHYSLIDMTLNGGLGDVVPGQKDILLVSGIAEGVLTARASNCEGYWAVLHNRLGNEYYAFKVDAGGVSTTPVISSGILGVPGYANYAVMRFNNARTRIVRGSGFVFETAAFDPATGAFGAFDTVRTNHGMITNYCFSPDDTKLYVSGNTGILQFDMGLMPNTAAIQAGQYAVLGGTLSMTMRLGPDQKIYTTLYGGPLRTISNPNAAGAACGYSSTPAIVLANNVYVNELGNPVVVNTPVDTVIPAAQDNTFCLQGEVTLSGVPDALSYSWSNGAATPQQVVSQDGVYWVRSFKNCVINVDTFHVKLVDFDVDLGNDTSICTGKPVVLDAFVPGASYQWQDGSGNATFTAAEKGRYSVTVTKDGCVETDEIQVDLLEPYLALREQDTLVCGNRPFTLHADAFPESSYSWNNGGTGASLQAADSGLYIVTASNVCGSFSDSVHVATMTCFCDAFVPNAFTPNGDGANDVLLARLNCPGITQFVMRVYNRYGQRLFDSNDIDRGWDGMQRGSPVDVGTYYYYVEYKGDDGAVVKKKGEVTVLR